MSGHDLRDQVPFKLMRGRLGACDKHTHVEATNVEGIADQHARIKQHGGSRQQERMIKDKRRSLDHAVKYSYQAAEIKKVDNGFESQVAPALINPNKLKPDYDDKVLSIGFEYGIQCGDVFEWIGTNTHWIVYLQDMTELAYFRGDIRKCSYVISWQDDSGIHTTYAAVRGPVETKINSNNAHGLSIDMPNHSLHLLLPNNEETFSYFKRYNKFYLNGDSTCWRIEAVDWVSMPNVLEINAVEYYANETEDDIANGIVGGLTITPEEPENNDAEIRGESFIKVKKTYAYECRCTQAHEWTVDNNMPVVLTPCATDPRKVSVQWTSSYSGQFTLRYGEFEKTIVVESLF